MNELRSLIIRMKYLVQDEATDAATLVRRRGGVFFEASGSRGEISTCTLS